MNSLILWATARIIKLKAANIRIAAGAGVGAAYSFAAAFPELDLLHGFWPKIAISVLMFAVVFAPLKLKRFITSMAVFYIVSFSLGGFFIGILYFFKSSPFGFYTDSLSQLVAAYFWPGLLLTVGLYFFCTRFIGRLIQKRLVADLFHVQVKISFGEADIEVEALIDTGNQLQDPLSQTPVIVVEYNALKNLLPPEIQIVFEYDTNPDLMMVLNSLAETSWSARFRVIPFTSLGQSNGMLIGFRPDRIEVRNGSNHICTKNVIVGVYCQELSPEGSYRALLHPDVLNGLSA
jgi:stage II sporulation protein GA (sporulation sigma-E factor processing peptidase)